MEVPSLTNIYASQKESQKQNGKIPESNNERLISNIGLYFSEFCQSTSIHGFRFLGERNRYCIERIWWFLVVPVTGCSCALLIYEAYWMWRLSPVLVTFARTETPIWNIPFPAVTICPETKVNPEVFNYSDVYLKYINNMGTTEQEDEYYNLFSMVCDKHSFSPHVNGTKTIGLEEYETFMQALMDLDIKSCRWLQDEYNCSELLTYSYTSEGLCRTFNMVAQSDLYVIIGEQRASNQRDWSLEDGYSSFANLNTIPRRTMLSGLKAGFQLDLSVHSGHLDYFCTDQQGFKVTLHNPAEEPDMEKHIRLPLNQAVVVGIKPRIITTAKELRNYTPNARQCYLSREKALGNFKIYTQESCMFGCLANYTLEACRCIAFYMPYCEENRIYTCGSRKTNKQFTILDVEGRQLCGSQKRKCLEKAKLHFLEREVTSKVEGEISKQCGCLPACTFLQFDTETSQTEWDWSKTADFVVRSSSDFDFVDKVHYSRLMVYYKDMQFMTSERQELYGIVEFCANCGGLLGLFCGLSFTSVVEILYFLTLRLICNLKNFGRIV